LALSRLSPFSLLWVTVCHPFLCVQSNNASGIFSELLYPWPGYKSVGVSSAFSFFHTFVAVPRRRGCSFIADSFSLFLSPLNVLPPRVLTSSPFGFPLLFHFFLLVSPSPDCVEFFSLPARVPPPPFPACFLDCSLALGAPRPPWSWLCTLCDGPPVTILPLSLAQRFPLLEPYGRPPFVPHANSFPISVFAIHTPTVRPLRDFIFPHTHPRSSGSLLSAHLREG